MGPEEDTQLVAAALARITPPGVRCGVRPIDDRDLDELHPAELAAVRSAATVRQHEFASGRALLRCLIGGDIPIPVGNDRKPVLPHDIVASIAHDRRLVVGAAAPRTTVAAIGIDVEPFTEIEPDVARAVLRPDDGTDDALLAFVLKEAAYKAWSNAGGRPLEHPEVRVDVGNRARSTGDYTATVAPEGIALAGRYASTGDAWLAVVVIGRGRDTRWAS